MESAGARPTSQGDRMLDNLYDLTTANGGTALQFRIFDAQLSGSLNGDWLRQNREADVTVADLEWMMAEGLLRLRTNPRGEEGYILYTPSQAATLKKLMQTKRYAPEELRHIMNDWDDYLEAVVMDEPPYDDTDVPDYKHFIRRAHEMRDQYAEQERELSALGASPASPATGTARTNVHMWRTTCEIVDRKSEDELSSDLLASIHRQLFHLRWWDEFVRLTMANQFQTAISQGYGTDVTFDGFTGTGAEITLGTINWRWTLEQYQRTRREGKDFPLRTPEFNITENGVEFLQMLPPSRYTEIYESYRLEELKAELAKFGSDLWMRHEMKVGDAVCPGCEQPFQRTSPRRVYCSEPCRIRAKSKRWRDRNPEEARQAQARYWTSVIDPK